ncbi:MAG: cysteine desulfurase [Marinilabiliaceae bacterium]|nr:cysteine desulfurase [Marinilabiliaceae bacterium]
MTPKEANIRSEFPLLREKIYGKYITYLDNGATTQKPRCVLQCIEEIYEHYNSNIHRGVHYLSNKCTDLFEQARHTIAEHLNAREDAEVIFTRGTTEAINLLAYSFGETFCKEGDEIIVSEMEHHANIVPWQMLCERKRMTLRVIPITDNGELVMESVEPMISERTRLIAVTHVSNVMGTINDVERIIKIAHSHNVPVLVDGAQSMPHVRIDVQAMDCDFLAFSGHKMYAPNGSGALYGKREYLDKMVPYHGGGEMIDHVSFKGTTYNVIPFKFEAGTPDYVSAIALAEAIRFMESLDMDYIMAHEQALVQYALHRMRSLEGMRIIGDAKYRSGAISFLVGKIHHYDMGMILDKMGIAVRTGHHCAQPLMERMGITGTVRASFGVYNTEEDVEALIKGIMKATAMLG